MKTINFILLTLLIYLYLPKESVAQWILKNNGLKTNYGNSFGIDAYQDKTAIVGFFSYQKAYIYKTTNGGDNWFELTWVMPSDPISVSILDSNKIWAATSDGKILATNNGGTSWNLQFSDLSRTDFLNYIKMFDENNGIAMGDAPAASNKPLLILRTTNGGLNWISMNDSFFIGGFSRNARHNISFVSPTTGYMYPSIFGQVQDKVFKTTDAGKTWSPFQISPPVGWNVKFYNENIGFVVAYGYTGTPKLNRTTNGGITWEIFNSPSPDVPWDLEFVPGYPNKVWLTDHKKLFFSEDMGATWDEQFVSINNLRANGIAFGDSKNGWLFCREGKIYKTSNGDRITSVKDEQSIKPSSYALYQNYPNPFNPETNIKFQIPSTNHVTLIIYNILGREVATLVNEEKPAGIYEITFNSELYNLTSGVYFYRLISKNYSETKKLLLLR